MSLSIWIAVILWAIGQITALVIAYINVRVKIKELEMKIDAQSETIKTNQHSFHIHEQQNEKLFDKFEKKMDAVHETVNEVKTILISKGK